MKLKKGSHNQRGKRDICENIDRIFITGLFWTCISKGKKSAGRIYYKPDYVFENMAFVCHNIFGMLHIFRFYKNSFRKDEHDN